MRLIPLTSSSIAAIGWRKSRGQDEYDDALGHLVVQFQNKQGDWSAYLYFDVPQTIFVDIITDPESQGKTFDRLVKKGGFSWVKVTPDEVRAIP